MKKYGIIVLVLLITAVLSGCISKPEPKFKEGDLIKPEHRDIWSL